MEAAMVTGGGEKSIDEKALNRLKMNPPIAPKMTTRMKVTTTYAFKLAPKLVRKR
jgi:hypothetical protein